MHFQPISDFISEVEMMQDRAIVTMEGKCETVPKLLTGAILLPGAKFR